MTTLRFNQPNLRTIDSFLDSLINENRSNPKPSGFQFPAVNIIESNHEYQIEMNAPGRKKEDFKISVDKNILTISYSTKVEENKEEKKEDSRKYIKQEFISKDFKRSFTLDEKIDAEKIAAKYDDGILYLTLPKKEEVKILPKEIAVN
ncbi:MAG: Hsp20/alpha crystallin family protein [Ginsengibacter sp.]